MAEEGLFFGVCVCESAMHVVVALHVCITRVRGRPTPAHMASQMLAPPEHPVAVMARVDLLLPPRGGAVGRVLLNTALVCHARTRRRSDHRRAVEEGELWDGLETDLCWRVRVLECIGTGRVACLRWLPSPRLGVGEGTLGD